MPVKKKASVKKKPTKPAIKAKAKIPAKPRKLSPGTQNQLTARPNTRTGRPSKFNDQYKEKILQGIRLGLEPSRACVLAGLTFETLNIWRAKALNDKLPDYIAFFEDIEKAKVEHEAIHLRNIHEAASGGTWTASAWTLERMFPDRYSLKTRTEITGKDGGPVQQEIKVISTSDILKALEIITVIPNEQQMAAIGHGDSNEGDSEDSTSYNS